MALTSRINTCTSRIVAFGNGVEVGVAVGMELGLAVGDGDGVRVGAGIFFKLE